MGKVRAEMSLGSVATGTMHRSGIYIHVILMYLDRDTEAHQICGSVLKFAA